MQKHQRAPQPPSRKFTAAELKAMNGTIAIGQSEFDFQPHPIQAMFMAYLYLYLDHEIGIRQNVPLLEDMRHHFRVLSKDRANPRWAVYFYYSYVLDGITGYLKEIDRHRCGINQ
ncbi:MAG: hypothetical protein JO301_16975 [Chitinophagaceae bacterium]|nr:hypothetical protein [Chitinophagaceae bacterium]